MEEELVKVLHDTASSTDAIRKPAELQLQNLSQQSEAFPLALISVAAHDNIPTDVRQAALLNLKTFVLANWSNQFDEFKGQVSISEDTKSRLRHALLQLATNGREERRVEAAASYCVSKIASADFPTDWPGKDTFCYDIEIGKSNSQRDHNGPLSALILGVRLIMLTRSPPSCSPDCSQWF
jgi:importin-9